MNVSWSKPVSGLELKIEISEVFHESKTKFHEVMIGQTRAFGKGLFLNQVPQSFASDQFLYHSALVHPAMLRHPKPENILIGGGAEGATLREVLRHPSVKNVTMVDIDGELVEICKRHLLDWNENSFADPRVVFVADDICSWIKNSESGSFDVALFDLGDPLEGGHCQQAFTQEFFQDVRRTLRSGGIFGLQAGEIDLYRTFPFRAVRDTLKAVFGSSFYYHCSIPSYFGDWGFVVASDASINGKTISAFAGRADLEVVNGPNFSPEFHDQLVSFSPRIRRSLNMSARIITSMQPLTPSDLNSDW